MDQPCKACPRTGNRSAWKLIGCRRGKLEVEVHLCAQDLDKDLPLPEGLLQQIESCLSRAEARRKSEAQTIHLDTSCPEAFEVGSFPVSTAGQELMTDVPENVQQHCGQDSGTNDNRALTGDGLAGADITALSTSKLPVNHLQSCPTCFSGLDSGTGWSCALIHHTFRESIFITLWKLRDQPDALRIWRLESTDIPRLSQLLAAASRYEIEEGDVSQHQQRTVKYEAMLILVPRQTWSSYQLPAWRYAWTS